MLRLRLQLGKKEKDGIKWGEKKKKILRAIITVISPSSKLFRHIHFKIRTSSILTEKKDGCIDNITFFDFAFCCWLIWPEGKKIVPEDEL